MMQFLFLFSFLWLQGKTVSSVHVLVADAAGTPLPNVRATLVLYDFEFKPGQTEVKFTFSDRCTTDPHGECTIVIGETSGLLRGRLDLGKYGGRDVIWPGGALNAPVLVDLDNHRIKGLEAQPFDFQEKDGGVTVKGQTPWIVILIVTVIVGGLVSWAYLQSKREHA